MRRDRAVHDERALAAQALRLAAGRASEAEAVDWSALHAVARRERLAPLAWTRCGAHIVERADAPTAAAWRRDYLGASVRAFRLLALAGELTAGIAERGHRAVLLKGAALAHRLYGDAAARPSTDVDLFVPAEGHAAAADVATQLGWRRGDAGDGRDLLFSRASDDGEMFLEIHASLLDERLAFLRVPAPESAPVAVDGVRLHAHDGPLVPAYLASHLATHTLPPLLWWLDWWTLWSTTDASGRLAARLAARDAGLHGYLAWAERRFGAIDRALAGDAAALSALGVGPRGRQDVHQLVRHVALAPDARAAASAMREWARPRWAAKEDGGPVLGTVRRLARHWRLLLPARQGGDAPHTNAPVATRSASGADLLGVAREVVTAGGEMWLGVTGRSMAPTIAEGDSVLLTALDREPRAGDVVLAGAAPGPVLHRVREVAASDAVVTQGDACVTPDVGVTRASVVARAVAVRRGGVVAALAPTLRFGVAPLVRYWIRSSRRPRRLDTPIP